MQLQREMTEGGHKLMWNMSSEEQQALKPITRCTKITVDLTHEEQLLFCAQIKTLGSQVSRRGCELFCFLNIVITAFLFTVVTPWREQRQTWQKRYIRCDVLQYLIKGYEPDLNLKQPDATADTPCSIQNPRLVWESTSISYFSKHLSYIMDNTSSRFGSLDHFTLIEGETCSFFLNWPVFSFNLSSHHCLMKVPKLFTLLWATLCALTVLLLEQLSI